MTVTITPTLRSEVGGVRGRAVFDLARFEGRMMLRHPVLWVGALASVGLAVFELIEQAPVLNRASMTLAWTMAPLAAATALVSGWAVLRARGSTDAQPSAVMPLGMPKRVAGIVLGLAWPAAATFLIQMALLAWTFTRDPVTSLVWSELLVGPIYVLFAGAAGAALTRWIPHPSTPLFGLVVLGGVQAVFPYDPSQWGLRIGPAALAPIAWPEEIIPYEVAFRPSLLHLGYLAALAIGLAGVASLGRRLTSWLALAAGLVLAATLGAAQLGPIEESRRIEAVNRLVGDQADLVCETHDAVTYCSMPGYEAWIDEWREAVAPVIEVAPPRALEGIQVRQYPVHYPFFDAPDAAPESWWWVEPAAADYRQRDVVAANSIWAEWAGSDLIRRTATKVMGCGPLDDCSGESQRMILTWLVAHNEQSRSYILYDAEFSDHVQVSECMVAEMWGRPGVEDLIRANWDSLTSPETTYAEAGELLGVAVPEGPKDEFHRIPAGCP